MGVRLVRQGPKPPTLVALTREHLGRPAVFGLDQNHPNPFNNSTVIRFALPRNDRGTLAVYNLTGQRVATLVDGVREAGTYTVPWDGWDDKGQVWPAASTSTACRSGHRCRAASWCWCDKEILPNSS